MQEDSLAWYVAFVNTQRQYNLVLTEHVKRTHQLVNFLFGKIVNFLHQQRNVFTLIKNSSLRNNIATYIMKSGIEATFPHHREQRLDVGASAQVAPPRRRSKKYMIYEPYAIFTMTIIHLIEICFANHKNAEFMQNLFEQRSSDRSSRRPQDLQHYRPNQGRIETLSTFSIENVRFSQFDYSNYNA